MKNRLFPFLLLALGLSLAFTACNREKIDTDTTSSEDHALAENESDAIIELIDHEIEEAGVNKITNTWLPSCATVTIDSASSPKSFTIDFGTTGCLCSDWDGKTRKGIVTVTWTGRYRDAGTVVTVSTDSYYVDDVKFEYAKTVTNNGTNADGQSYFSVNVSSAVITFEDGSTANWTSDRTRTFVEGESTLLNPFDNVYEITGEASGTNRNGRNFSAEVTKALRVEIGCRWITEGTLELTPDGLNTRVLDYGDGTCDNKATVTVEDKVYEIVLR